MFFHFLRFLAGISQAFVSEASAVSLDHVGEDSPSVAGMWAHICGTVLPAFYCGLGASAPTYFLLRVIQFVLSLVGAAAVCMLIYAGIQLITGGEEKKADAKRTATHALLGLVLALMADAIVAYVIGLVYLGFKGT